jgi:hypothetical protein
MATSVNHSVCAYSPRKYRAAASHTTFPLSEIFWGHLEHAGDLSMRACTARGAQAPKEIEKHLTNTSREKPR